MGAILLIVGNRSREYRERRLAEMAGAAPYRGKLRSLSFDAATFGIQQLGDDACLYRDPRIAIAMVGYIRSEQKSDNRKPDIVSLADRLAAWGDRALDGLQGEFTLLVRYAATGSFLLLRSLAGKSACYAVDEEGLVIASEARQIRATAHREFPLDMQALLQQAFYQRILEAPDRTHFSGIRRFLATSVYRFSATSPNPQTVRRYWQPEGFNPPGLDDSGETAQLLLGRIREATAQSLASRPGHLALSGGLDSGTLWSVIRTLEGQGNALAAQVSSASQVYPGMDCDESTYLDALDATFGPRGVRIDMRGITAGSQSANLLRTLPDHPPLSTLPHVLPLLEQVEQQGSKVLYLGLGGDEWFSLGNHWYTLHPLYQAIAQVAGFAHTGPLRRLGLCGKTVLRQVYRSLATPLGHRATHPMLGPAARDWPALARQQAENLLDRMPVTDALDRLTVQRWAGQAFEIIEQLSATRGIEVRLPLMNIRLAGLCHRLAPALRHQPGLDKAMLRRAMRGTLPEKISGRIGKTRFESVLINDPELLRGLPRPEKWRTVESGYVDPGHARHCYDRAMQGHLPSNWLINTGWLEHYLNAYF